MRVRHYIESDVEEIVAALGRDVEAFAGKTVVFTGAGGFLGLHFMALFERLNRHALARPVRVIAIDNFVASTVDAADFTEFESIELRHHDIVQPLEVLDPVDYVLHAAGIASPVWYKVKPLETLEVATVGTRNALDVARSAGARFLYFSSSEIYGNPDAAHLPTAETYPGNVSSFGPRSCYDEGKRVGETLCYIYGAYFGVPATIVRPFNVYGPGMRERDYRVLPNFAARIKSRQPLLVYGSGRQTRTFCYVVDALVGALLALLRGAPGEAYNIGNPTPEISIADLARRMCAIAPDGTWRLVEYPEEYPGAEPERRCPDIAKAARDLGFRPHVSLDDGLRRYLSWTDAAYSGEALAASSP